MDQKVDKANWPRSRPGHHFEGGGSNPNFLTFELNPTWGLPRTSCSPDSILGQNPKAAMFHHMRYFELHNFFFISCFWFLFTHSGAEKRLFLGFPKTQDIFFPWFVKLRFHGIWHFCSPQNAPPKCHQSKSCIDLCLKNSFTVSSISHCWGVEFWRVFFLTFSSTTVWGFILGLF